MSEALLIALMNFAAKVGFDAAIAFLRASGANVHTAIAALEAARDKALAQYKADDLARRNPA